MAATEKNPGNRLRIAQIFIVDSALTIAGLAVLGGGIYSVFFKDSPTITATCIGAGLILLFAATIHRFEVLKGFGIEAKVKRLDATIDKAEIALKQLKDLTEITTKSVLVLSSKAGRWSGAPSIDDAHELAMNAKRILESVAASRATIRKILLPWVQVEACDMARVAIQPFQKEFTKLSDQLQAQISELGSPILPDKLDAYNALAKRLNFARNYVSANTRKVSDWPIDEITARISKVIEDAPEITEAQRSQFRDESRPFLEQIDFLVQNFDFRDIEFWRNHVRVG